VTTPSRRKGDRAEREAVELLAKLGLSARHRYGAGMRRRGNLIIGTAFVAQVRNLADDGGACAESAIDAKRQATTAGVAYSVGMARRRGGRWVVTMTPDTFAALAYALDERVDTASPKEGSSAGAQQR
jgi:hypothetical protein